MATLIGFESNTKKGLAQLESWPDLPPQETAFWVPDEAQGGDRVLWYIAGTLNSFVAIGKIRTDWRVGRSGAWKGVWQVGTTVPQRLAPFVSGRSVAHACGYPVPTDAGVVPAYIAATVVGFLRGKPIDRFDRAIEGARTESRSHRRSDTLRRRARERANGLCECCGNNFKKVAGGLGQSCLVVHHKKQIKDYDTPAETRLADLAVVCANCHLMIHSDPRHALSVAALRRRLTSDGRGIATHRQ